MATMRSFWSRPEPKISTTEPLGPAFGTAPSKATLNFLPFLAFFFFFCFFFFLPVTLGFLACRALAIAAAEEDLVEVDSEVFAISGSLSPPAVASPPSAGASL